MRKKSGYTLVELTIAIAVIAIIFPILISALFNPMIESIYGDQLVQATALAQERLEEIYSTKANEALGYDYITEANFPDESPVTDFIAFDRDVTITEVSGNDLETASSGSGFKKIDVTVTWDTTNTVIVTGVVSDF